MIASLRGWMKVAAACAALLVVLAAPPLAQQPEAGAEAQPAPGGEASLVLPAWIRSTSAATTAARC